MFKSLRRLSFQVEDPVRAKQWYSRILGAEPVFDSPYFVVFKIGDCSLSLIAGDQPLKPDSGRMCSYWEVEDVDAAYRQLIEAGATPHVEVRNINNIRIGQVYDPFGNLLGLTGPALEEVVEKQPSETAIDVAFFRALAACDPREEMRCPDNLALHFLTEDRKRPLNNPAARAAIIQMITPAVYGYMIARTIFIDQIVKQELAGGIPQIVFLGAGYDSRSYRFSSELGTCRIFELDIATTQGRKKDLLANAGIAIPPQLTFVPIDFRSQSLTETLEQAGYSPDLRALFVWEGVMYYLTAPAVETTLDFIRSHARPGSSVVFDYLKEKRESSNTGEPFHFYKSGEEMAAFLAERGFSTRENLGQAQIEKRFLTLKDGTLAWPSVPYFGMIQAFVQS